MNVKEIFSFSNREQARSVQEKLSHLVVQTDDSYLRPRRLCGIDVAYDRDTAFVAAAVWETKRREITQTRGEIGKVSTPYVPGFLAFREGPLLIEMATRIRPKPDVFLVDAHGVAHPRGFGLACHVGLVLDKPTIGVAKSLLHGKIENDRIVDSKGMVIGAVLTTRIGKEVFVSVGHRLSLSSALRITSSCMIDGQPVPLARAHRESILLKERNLERNPHIS